MSSDLLAPRVFNVVTSKDVNYHMDFVEYLIHQEAVRRKAAKQPALNERETAEFRRQLISKLIVQGDAEGAIKLRPTPRIQLNG
jgi:predicted nucleic acid-binding Zn ribbon protein